jgi:hypothetical protein
MTVIADQPPPKATDRRPTWDMVMSYVDQLRCEGVHVSLGIDADVIGLVLGDMRDRDAVGVKRHGARLTSGNGRDHLVDAYQELLDSCVYLMNELDEHGVDLSTELSDDVFPDKAHRWYLLDIQQLCVSQIRASIHLRAVMEERGRRQLSTSEVTS